jgi:hypothetical protein
MGDTYERFENRYKILYCGRGGIKSWSIAQHLLIAGAQRSLRIPCDRDTRNFGRDMRERERQADVLASQILETPCSLRAPIEHY